jgi:phenylpropionate dioxygenase-like ring-hydroxylating dioxygenase large terminal subunit
MIDPEKLPEKLIDLERKTVSPQVFADPEVHRLEQERIFTRCWLYVGHESQLPNPGDFIAGFMGEEPVIVCRGPDRQIRVFLNSCRHRGMLVCRVEEGNAKFFRCPYHGWTYDLEGQLTGVPDFRKAYHGDLKREEWPLLRAPKVSSYRGLIFACLDEHAVSLDEYLGDFRWYLDLQFNRTERGMIALPGTHKWTLKANWKFAAEQFGGDNYHTMWAHESGVRTSIAQQFGGEHPWTNYWEAKTKEGHGWINIAFEDPPGIAELIGPYTARLREQAGKRLTPTQVDQIGCVHVGTVFPNFSLLSFLGFLSVRVWHPRGPTRLDAWSWALVERDAAPEVIKLARDIQIRTFSPAGIFEQDDGEMWSYCTEAAQGAYRRRFPLNYQMGAGYERPDPDRPGLIHPPPTEISVFGFWERWRRQMANKETR